MQLCNSASYQDLQKVNLYCERYKCLWPEANGINTNPNKQVARKSRVQSIMPLTITYLDRAQLMSAQSSINAGLAGRSIVIKTRRFY